MKSCASSKILYQPITRKKMSAVENIYYSLIITGIFIIIITLSLSSVIGYLLGYSFIVAGYILMLGYLLFALSGKTTLSTMLTNVGPLIALIGVILYYLSIVGMYKDRISAGIVAPSYYSFSNIFLTLILIQTMVFYRGTQSNQFKQTLTINKMTSMMFYLLTVITVLTVISIHIILAYFSTDG